MDERRPVSAGVERASTRELIAHVADDTRRLVKDEIQLAKSEARENLRAEVKAGIGLGVGGVLGIMGVTLLLAALGLGLLGPSLPDWAALLIVAGAALVVGAIVGAWGWMKRVRTPLEKTRDSVKETVQWTRREIH